MRGFNEGTHHPRHAAPNSDDPSKPERPRWGGEKLEWKVGNGKWKVESVLPCAVDMARVRRADLDLPKGNHRDAFVR